ncbi:hypothetical protein DCC39_10200 [Pueribacillus theae]|uniref:Phage terminase large subunit N-terminal domain-containing protein n=1 Tax=Pueribacillus theae TaxID=2171751 RepID=A0A2U1K0R3_9BACI|nr:phage terminase large subunit [Pueribacillus theae]PWA11061.1 hypothetical protein DCC39_10200 [Pueribacillus theae]
MAEFLPYNEQACKMCGKPYKEGSDTWWGFCATCGYLEQFYNPLPAQQEFHASPSKYRLYAGGFGSGKTLCGCQESIQLALRYPGNFILVGAQTYPNLRDTTLRTFLEIVPHPVLKGGSIERAFNKAENMLEFHNGSSVIFRSMDDPNKYKSLNLGAFYIDEVSEVAEEIWMMLESRLRRNTVPRRTGFGTTNPEGGSWVYSKFVQNNGKSKNYSYFQAPTTENIYLPEDYVQGLLDSYPESWVKRYIYADWSAFEGQVFPEFQPTIPYVIPHVDPNPEHPVYFGLDHGLHNPTAALWGSVNPEDGTLYIYQEYYEKNQLVEHHAANIKFMSKDTAIFGHWIDPATQNRNAVTGKSVRSEYLRLGVPVTLGNNDLHAGIHKISEYLKKDKHGKPKIVISERCEHLIEELSQYRWEKAKPRQNEPEKPHSYKDHTVDALRYMVMGLPRYFNDSPASMISSVPPPLPEFYEPGEEDIDRVEIYSGLI